MPLSKNAIILISVAGLLILLGVVGAVLLSKKKASNNMSTQPTTNPSNQKTISPDSPVEVNTAPSDSAIATGTVGILQILSGPLKGQYLILKDSSPIGLTQNPYLATPIITLNQQSNVLQKMVTVILDEISKKYINIGQISSDPGVNVTNTNQAAVYLSDIFTENAQNNEASLLLDTNNNNSLTAFWGGGYKYTLQSSSSAGTFWYTSNPTYNVQVAIVQVPPQ